MTTARPITSLKPRMKHGAQHDQQQHRQHHPLAIFGPVGMKSRRMCCQSGLCNQVLGGVGGRQRLGDDEVGGGEAQQDQHQDLAASSRAPAARACAIEPWPCGDLPAT